MLPLYKTLVRPLLEYAIAVWNPHLKKDIENIERVQRRATKLIKSIKDKAYPDRLRILNLDSLQFRRRRNDIIQVFRIIRKIDKLHLSSFFTLHTQVATRGHELKLAKPRALTNCRLKSFSHRVVNDWNNLKPETIKCTTLNAFKNALSREWKNHPERFFNP